MDKLEFERQGQRLQPGTGAGRLQLLRSRIRTILGRSRAAPALFDSRLLRICFRMSAHKPTFVLGACLFALTGWLGAAALNPDTSQPPKIAVIGAGIGGSFTSAFLYDRLDSSVSIDVYAPCPSFHQLLRFSKICEPQAPLARPLQV